MNDKRRARMAPAEAGAEFETAPQRRYREAVAKSERSYKLQVESNREWAERAAQKLERNEPLSKMDRKLAAGVLRLWAGQISDAPPRPANRPATFDHAALAFDYYKYRDRDGISDSEAKQMLADEYQIDERHVARIVAKYLPGIEAFLGPCGQTRR